MEVSRNLLGISGNSYIASITDCSLILMWPVTCDLQKKPVAHDPTSKFQEWEIGSDLILMQCKIKICKTDFFCQLRECEIKNSSKSVEQIVLKFCLETWFTPTNQLCKFNHRLYGRFSSNPRSKTGFYNLGRELNCACPLFKRALILRYASRAKKQEWILSSFTGCLCTFSVIYYWP